MTKLLFQSIVGSRAFELQRDNSDTDVRGVYGATLAETLDPCVPVVAPPNLITACGIDVYYHELTHFLELLNRQDGNAWQALCSRKGLVGTCAQSDLRHLALRYILQPEVMLDKAQRSAYTMMQEAERKESGKIAVIAMRNLSFAQCVAGGTPLYGFNLGKHEQALDSLLGTWNLTEAHILYNEIRGRHTYLVETEAGHGGKRRQALLEYYSHYIG
jgi:Predicted nucleotidyltransferase.